MLTLLWFKRDLRVQDNPALAIAAEMGQVLPLYIVEPQAWAQPDASARQWAFIAESLADLRADLAALGQPLLIRAGDAVEVLAQMHRRHRFAQILSHEETGNDWSYARDRRVADWVREQGLVWREVPQSGVVRRLKGRDGWAGMRDRFMAQEPATAPRALAPVAPASGEIPGARALGLAEDRCPGRQTGGRRAAEATLSGFLAARGQDYRRAMSSPLSAERACSRLSPYLAFGVLSAREVVQVAARTRAERRGEPGWAASLKSFESRLAWRDHFIQKLEDEPALEYRALHRALDGLRPRLPDAERLQAWASGQTGLPFVDACMRYLAATGWLNFRMRAMLMSVASYHLWLDWRATGRHLARLFTDYEPGIHWSQCQMQSGTTGINTLRIYNPVKQGLDQDPEGRFIRTWVPELAAVPDGFVHEPWRWPGAAGLPGRRYPAPVVDPAAAAREAKALMQAARARAGFGAEAARVAQRHASRQNRARQFVNDRAPRPRRRAGGDGGLGGVAPKAREREPRRRRVGDGGAPKVRGDRALTGKVLHGPDATKGRSASEALCHLWSPHCLAAQMGAGLGGRPALFRTLPTRAKISGHGLRCRNGERFDKGLRAESGRIVRRASTMGQRPPMFCAGYRRGACTVPSSVSSATAI